MSLTGVENKWLILVTGRLLAVRDLVPFTTYSSYKLLWLLLSFKNTLNLAQELEGVVYRADNALERLRVTVVRAVRISPRSTQTP